MTKLALKIPTKRQKAKTKSRLRRSTILFPRLIERQYLAEMNKQLKVLRSLFTRSFFQEVSFLNQESKELRQDAPADDIQERISRIKSEFNSQSSEPESNAFVEGVAMSVASNNLFENQRFIKKETGVDVPFDTSTDSNDLKLWVKNNVRLIKTVPERLFNDVEQVVFDGFQQGLSNREVSKQIREKFKISRNNAKRIAVDQVATLNSRLTKKKQTQLGIREYIWRTQQDERVRGNPSGLYPNASPSHFAREGKKFRWDKPPSDGNPGEPIRCRCIAEPILESSKLFGGKDKPLKQKDIEEITPPAIPIPTPVQKIPPPVLPKPKTPVKKPTIKKKPTKTKAPIETKEGELLNDLNKKIEGGFKKQFKDPFIKENTTIEESIDMWTTETNFGTVKREVTGYDLIRKPKTKEQKRFSKTMTSLARSKYIKPKSVKSNAVYRGITLDQKVLKDFKIGDSLPQQLESWSTDPGIAAEFSWQGKGNRNIVMIIKDNKRGSYIKNISNIRREEEVIKKGKRVITKITNLKELPGFDIPATGDNLKEIRKLKEKTLRKLGLTKEEITSIIDNKMVTDIIELENG